MRASRILPLAAAVYVFAWLAGLVAAPSRPTDGADGALKGYFSQHGSAAVAQSLLVHGLAGVGLAAFAWALSRLVGRTSRAVLGLGLVAAALSLFQVVLLVPVAARADSWSAADVDQRVALIDTVDTAKLTVLAAFAVTASLSAAASGLGARWLTRFAAVLAALLVAGGTSFLVSSPVLTGALYVSLPLLLTWVGATGVVVGRNAAAPTGILTGVRR